jgi:hypothetical protein
MTYLGEGDIGDNDSVHGAGSSTEGLALVTVRVVLILVDLAILRGGVPGHSTLADANVASLGGDGGGLAAEVPIEKSRRADRSVIALGTREFPKHCGRRMTALCAPWYRTEWHYHFAAGIFGLSEAWGGSYLPAGKEESTRHDTEEDL